MSPPLNVILLLLDGMRSDALDAHPVFADLERRGLFCGNLLTYAPYTTASMHALLTGIYGTRNGVDSYLSASRFRSAACRTLAQTFQSHGYYTAVDINNRNTIPCQGYERVEEYDEFHPDNRNHLVERHQNALAEARRTRRPFLLSLHNLKTHAELIQQFRDHFPGDKEALYYADPARNEREYRGYARGMGDDLAALLAELDRTQFFQNGLLVVFSDHGCSYGEQPGERMYGTYLHEYTTRTFATFIGPGFKPGDRRHGLLRTVDILPTLLEACGWPTAHDVLQPDGLSFLQTDPHDCWGFVETSPLGGDFPSPSAPNYHGVASATHKLLYHSGRDQLEFFERSGPLWRPQPANSPLAEEWLLRLASCSPIVNRNWLAKLS